MTGIPDGITVQDVRDAIAALDRSEPHAFGDSTGYDLIHAGRRYPPKAVLGLAARRVLGRSLGPYDFKGGAKSQAFRILRELGFTIERKPGPVGPGTDWQEEEIRAVVEEYFDMLARELRGEPVNKAERCRAVKAQLRTRSEKSIEYKFQDVSGVLHDVGFPFIDGFKPARNYQRGLFTEVILEFLGSEDDRVVQIERSMREVPKVTPREQVFASCEVSPPERQTQDVEPPPPSVRRWRRAESSTPANRLLKSMTTRNPTMLDSSRSVARRRAG